MNAVPVVFLIKPGVKNIISTQVSFITISAACVPRHRAKACEITERENTVPQKQEVVPVSFMEQEFCIPPSRTAGAEEFHPDTVITVYMNGIQIGISNNAARETIAHTISVLQGSC